MKKSVLLLILFPLFLNAQNETPEKWRFNFGYQFEGIGASGDENIYNLDHIELNKQPPTGHALHLSFSQYLSKKVGFQYGLNYSNRNMTVITRHNSFGGLGGPPIVVSPISFNLELSLPLMAKVSHSNLELALSFFWEQKIGKFGISTIGGIGVSKYLRFETEMIDIAEFSSTFTEEVPIQGDFKPNRIIPFGKVQFGIFYDYSTITRFFLRPIFRMDFTKSQSDLLNNRFWALGGAVGVSVKI